MYGETAHLLDINAGLRTGLKEPDAVIFGQLLTLGTEMVTGGQDMGNNHFLGFISSKFSNFDHFPSIPVR